MFPLARAWQTGMSAPPRGEARTTARRGFTLVEVLAALLLIGIVLPAIMEGISVSQRTAYTARTSLEAAALAEAKLDEIVASGQWSSSASSGDFGEDHPGYRWEMQVADRDYNVSEVERPRHLEGADGGPIGHRRDARLQHCQQHDQQRLNQFGERDTAMSRNNRHRGFTLLEIILAMTMVAVLSMSLYMSLRAGIKARNGSIGIVTPIRAAEVAMEMIRQDLESALPPVGLLAGQIQSGGFQVQGTCGFVGMHQNDADAIQFYCIGDDSELLSAAANLDQTKQGGVRKVQFYVTTLSDGTPNVLVRGITNNLLSQVTTDPDEEVLCRNVKSFTLRYWDASSQTWQDEWDSTQLSNAMPTAVEVTLQLQWPDKDNGEPRTYRTSRIYSLSCYFDPTIGSVTAANGTQSTSGGAVAGGASAGKGTSGGATGASSGGTSGGGRGGGK